MNIGSISELENVMGIQQSLFIKYKNQEFNAEFDLILEFEQHNGYWVCEPVTGTLFGLYQDGSRKFWVPDLKGASNTSIEASISDLLLKIGMQLADGKKFGNYLDTFQSELIGQDPPSV